MDEIIQQIMGLDPINQILTIILSSFVSEDVTTIVSASAYFAGVISKTVFYSGIIGGFILGDILIYFIGRFFGRKRDRLLFLDLKILRKKAKIYNKQGFMFLMMTRFTPGLRSPSIFAAGISAYDFRLFLLAKTISAITLLTLVELFGTIILSFIGENKFLIAPIILMMIVLSVTTYKIFYGYGAKSFYYNIAKYKYFEFWPAWFFYSPVIVWYFLLGFRFRDLLLPIYANPAIEYGGFIGEKKSEIQKLFSKNSTSYLKTEKIDKNLSNKLRFEKIESFIEYNNLKYPIVLKPETGQRGKAVKLMKSKLDIKNYIRNADYDFIAQEYCDYKNEAGIFFYYSPKTGKPDIYSITIKQFPKIIGDGKSSIKNLILSDKRARYIAKTYFDRVGGKEEIERVLSKGQELRLVNAGNHSQGCIFANGAEYKTDELVSVFDKISQKLNGFNIGRYDIKFDDFDDLKKGKNFKIIELNGSGAEATHIYDKDISLVEAYKTLFKQWLIVFRIANKCKVSKLYNYDFWKFVREYFGYLKTSKSYDISS